ncbi:MAG: histidine-type phosphatase [Firmicutes bacterium]|nr:histidine-type phosphatase [Bacillota bacterium]MCM1401064.1 histidine-type phosphatase [Bacteroides sp.]
MKLISSAATVFTVALAAFNAGAVEPTQDIRQLANYYYAYPYPEKPLPKLTKAPKGYEPFHIEHYGRHGSRWHIGEWVYRQPIDLLRPAERNGKLTERGKKLMEQLRTTEKQSRQRSGELTSLGARQHRGIAQRMTKNFPQVFTDGSRIDARSTQVIRCILSMDNELQELAAYNPALDITSDASAGTVYYLNFEQDSIADKKQNSKPAQDALKAYKKVYPYNYDFIDLIISDPQFAADSIDRRELWHSLFRIATNSQSLDEPTDIWDLFNEKQLQDQALRNDANWFIRYGNTDLTEGSGPMRQRYLMRNFIESADTSILRAKPSANLRFGHDVAVVPMVTLMDLDGLGRKVNDLSTLPDFWRLYNITPMAANIQMIFYRPQGGKAYTANDVLVKVLLNEKEVTLPATPVSGPYYRWTDVRKNYLDRIGDARYPIDNSDY